MANLEVRVRTAVMLAEDALIVGEVPFRRDVIPQQVSVIQDIGGELFGWDVSDDRINWVYQLNEDGKRVFLDIIMDPPLAD